MVGELIARAAWTIRYKQCDRLLRIGFSLRGRWCVRVTVRAAWHQLRSNHKRCSELFAAHRIPPTATGTLVEAMLAGDYNSDLQEKFRDPTGEPNATPRVSCCHRPSSSLRILGSRQALYAAIDRSTT